LETEARKMAETSLSANAQERQGALDVQDPDPGMGLPLGEREAGTDASEGEVGDRVRGMHSTTVVEQDLGGAKGCTTQAPKRRKKKSSLTVRKGMSKRRGTT
jgi:hypothetical protein